MIKFLKVKGNYCHPDGKVIHNEATELLDDWGTICANKGFVYGVGVGIGITGACYGTWKLGKFIGHKIVDHKNQKEKTKTFSNKELEKMGIEPFKYKKNNKD